MYTPMQEAEFIGEMGRKRRRQILVAIPITIVGCMTTILARYDYPMIFGYRTWEVRVVVLGALALLLFHAANGWRCPGCEKRLPVRDFEPQRCPHCGATLAAPEDPWR